MVDDLVLGGFGAVYGDSTGGDEFARLALAAGEASFGENVYEFVAGFGGGEALGEKVEVGVVKIG